MEAIRRDRERKDFEKSEKLRIAEEVAEATRKRKERRMCLREQKRLKDLAEQIETELLTTPEVREYGADLPVYDIRSVTNKEAPLGMHTIGGYIGELIFSLSALQDFATANPITADFKFEQSEIEAFMLDYFGTEEFFPNAAQLHLAPNDAGDMLALIAEEPKDLHERLVLDEFMR